MTSLIFVSHRLVGYSSFNNMIDLQLWLDCWLMRVEGRWQFWLVSVMIGKKNWQYCKKGANCINVVLIGLCVFAELT